ncbi:MAG: hypothetical protein AAGJ56_05890 [Myxococcota bacterium]
MEVQRIDGPTTRQADAVIGERKPRLVDPFASSSFDSGASHNDLGAIRDAQTEEELERKVEELYPRPESVTIRTPSGIPAQSPALSDAHRKALVESISHMTDDQRKRYEDKQRTMGHALYTMIVAQLEQEKDEKDRSPAIPNPDELMQSQAMTNAVTDPYVERLLGDETVDYETSVTDSLIGGLWGFEEIIRDYVTKIDREQQMADEVRADIAELEELMADWPADQERQEFTYNELVRDENGEASLISQTEMLNREEAVELIRKLEESDQQLAGFGPAEQQTIQVVTHGWQQAMGTMSGILKAFDETLRNILQNAKA